MRHKKETHMGRHISKPDLRNVFGNVFDSAFDANKAAVRDGTYEELLAACRAARNILNDHVQFSDNETERGVFDQLNAAITKAEGGAL